jgi:hypothetical protein
MSCKCQQVSAVEISASRCDSRRKWTSSTSNFDETCWITTVSVNSTSNNKVVEFYENP